MLDYWGDYRVQLAANPANLQATSYTARYAFQIEDSIFDDFHTAGAGELDTRAERCRIPSVRALESRNNQREFSLVSGSLQHQPGFPTERCH